MNILFLTIQYPIGEYNDNLYTMLVKELKQHGHEITIVVAEEAKNVDKTKLSFENNIEVLRVKVGDQFGVSFIKKGITTIKLELLMIKAIKKYLSKRDFDLVIYATPPITFANVVRFCKKKYGCSSYLMLKDIFPQNAVDIEIIKYNGIMHRFFRKKEKNLYLYSDYIGCMSQANIDYILENNKYLTNYKVEYFPNTIKILPLKPKPNNFEIRDKLGIPNDKVVFIFGGNLGIPQGLGFLINCIEELRNYDNAYFLIVGDGTEREKTETLINRLKLDNVLLMQRLPKRDYDKLMLECDVGLVMLDKRFTIPNYPSRILSYMEMALPMLAATDNSSDIKDLLEVAECGLWTYSGDKNNFVEMVKYLCENKELRIQMGQSGRRYLEEHFNVSRSVKILESHFEATHT